MVSWPWAALRASLSNSFTLTLEQGRVANKMDLLTSQDKGREIPHQLFSQTKQTRHRENQFNLLPIENREG